MKGPPTAVEHLPTFGVHGTSGASAELLRQRANGSDYKVAIFHAFPPRYVLPHVEEETDLTSAFHPNLPRRRPTTFWAFRRLIADEMHDHPVGHPLLPVGDEEQKDLDHKQHDRRAATTY